MGKENRKTTRKNKKKTKKTWSSQVMTIKNHNQ